MTKKKQHCPKGHDAFKGGRDRSGRCLICKAEAAAAKAALQEQARAESRAAFERREAESARRAEQEYRRAIKAGGHVAARARWEELYDRTLEETGSRYGLCQWDDGACTRRTADIYCHVHNRQLEREAEQHRRARAEAGAP